MKKALVCLALCLSTPAVAAPMSRVLGVRDSHTLVVETNGAVSTVSLKNVEVAPDEEPQAADYLRRSLANAWVYIDQGDVYRSPDALYVNADMNRHPWRTMKYLGELDLGARPKGTAAGNKVTSPTLPVMVQKTPAPRRITTRPRLRQ